MTREFNIKRGDKRLAYNETLTRGGGSSIDLREADHVEFFMEDADNGDLLATGTANIEDAANGQVSYTLSGEDTARKGEHNAEWVIYWDTDGEHVETVPRKGFYTVRVNPQTNRGLDPAEVGPGDYSVRNLEVSGTISGSSEPLALGDTTIQGVRILQLIDHANAAGYRLQDIGDPEDLRDAVPQEYVDQLFSDNYVDGASNPATADWDLNNHNIDNPGSVGDQDSPADHVHTEQINNRPAGVTLGDSGDRIPLTTFQIAPGTTRTTTSDTYTSLATNAYEIMFEGSAVQMSNIEQLEIGFACVASSESDTASAYVRLNSYREGPFEETEVERTNTSGGFKASDYAPYPHTNVDRIGIEGRVEEGGECRVSSIAVFIRGILA